MVTVYALIATSILGYALTMGRDREAGVLGRLRVTPGSIHSRCPLPSTNWS
jgi:hypothetical protein